ncbi:hypothetical protein GCM10025772_21320 [Ferrimonas gelatinilytica]|uniref:Toxin CptA n=2 Tax=Ferrimonas gelatinilytica TaxID=1255257 RepID=A0ABP9S9Q8_9GAMM
MSGLLLLLVSVWSWPGPIHAFWWVGRLLLTLFLMWQIWRSRTMMVPPAFTLSPDGEGRWSATGERFELSPASRLLPGIALLRIVSGQQRYWHWCHHDSFEERHWRRLCRAVLVAQRRGVSTVG